jgi:translation initiation factor IF-3
MDYKKFVYKQKKRDMKTKSTQEVIVKEIRLDLKQMSMIMNLRGNAEKILEEVN